MCWEEQGPVSRVSLWGMIDHRQNQQLSFVKASFLLPPFLSPFPCLPFSQRPLLLSSWKMNTFSQKRRSGPCPPPPPPLGCAHCQIPAETHLISPASLQAGLTLGLKVMLPLLLFFKRKLGYWVRAKSTWGKAEGNGVGIDKWDPHLTSNPRVPRAELLAWHQSFLGITATQLIWLIWAALSPITCLMSTK